MVDAGAAFPSERSSARVCSTTQRTDWLLSRVRSRLIKGRDPAVGGAGRGTARRHSRGRQGARRACGAIARVVLAQVGIVSTKGQQLSSRAGCPPVR